MGDNNEIQKDGNKHNQTAENNVSIGMIQDNSDSNKDDNNGCNVVMVDQIYS